LVVGAAKKQPEQRQESRIFNTDEMDVSHGSQFLQDLENNIVAQFTGTETPVPSRILR
jgi:hypothetical protein